MNLPASRVLLVEDDVKMQEVLSVLLQEDHITLESAPNATEGLLGRGNSRTIWSCWISGLPGVQRL